MLSSYGGDIVQMAIMINKTKRCTTLNHVVYTLKNSEPHLSLHA